jgi:hypothetical protein
VVLVGAVVVLGHPQEAQAHRVKVLRVAGLRIIPVGAQGAAAQEPQRQQLHLYLLPVLPAVLVYLTQLAALPFTMRVAVGAGLTPHLLEPLVALVAAGLVALMELLEHPAPQARVVEQVEAGGQGLAQRQQTAVLAVQA